MKTAPEYPQPPLHAGDVCEVTSNVFCPHVREAVLNGAPYDPALHLVTGDAVLMHSGDVFVAVAVIDGGSLVLFRLSGRLLVIWAKRVKRSAVKLS